jgi:hypothetical protein
LKSIKGLIKGVDEFFWCVCYKDDIVLKYVIIKFLFMNNVCATLWIRRKQEIERVRRGNVFQFLCALGVARRVKKLKNKSVPVW